MFNNDSLRVIINNVRIANFFFKKRIGLINTLK